MIEIIAEIGQNFNGDLKLARELIKLAKECGADVAKFQVYDAKALFSKENNPWYDYNCKTELTQNHIKILNKHTHSEGLVFEILSLEQDLFHKLLLKMHILFF